MFAYHIIEWLQPRIPKFPPSNPEVFFSLMLAPPVSHETVVRWGGRVLVLQRADNETGFLNVLKQKDRKRKKPYYAKYLPDGEKTQRMLPGSSSATAWEAAAKLAYHLELQLELPAIAPRAPRRTSEVNRQSLSVPLPRSSPCRVLVTAGDPAGEAGEESKETGRAGGKAGVEER